MTHYNMDSELSNEFSNPKRLTTLAFDAGRCEGNNLLHQFVLDHSDPNNLGSASYINAVLLSMRDTSVNVLNGDGYTALHLAVLKNSLLMVKKLLSCLVNIDVNARCSTKNADTALHLAVKLNHLCIVQELLNKGADLNAKNADGITALCFAAQSGDLDAMKLLITEGADVNLKSGRRFPLHYAAAKSGNLEAVKLLVRSGADVNATDEIGETPLFPAARSLNNLETIKFLISSGADVAAMNSFKETFLYHAARSDNLATIEYFIRNGINVNAKNKNGDTLLHYSVQSGYLDCVKFLVSSGADVNAKNKNGKTPLHHAVGSRFLATVKFVVINGADVNIKCRNGFSSLYRAAAFNNLRIVPNIESVAYLIDQGADVNARDVEGFTPLHHLLDILEWKIKVLPRKNAFDFSQINVTFEVMKLLLERNADVNIENEKGEIPAYHVIKSGSYDIVKFTVNATDLIHIKDKYGTSLLCYALMSGLDVHEMVLASEIDTNAKIEGFTILLPYAVQSGNSEDVKWLLENGADPNARHHNGFTSLHYACRGSDHLDVIEMLLRKGSDVNAENDLGETPLHLAAYRSKSDYIQLLLERGADANATTYIKRHTPLHFLAIGCFEVDVKVIRVLLDKGADVNAKNRMGKTPLDCAEEYKNQLFIDALQCICNISVLHV